MTSEDARAARPSATSLLESVVNVSEGRDRALLADLARAAQPVLLDVHADGDHHRSVFTLGGPAPAVEAAVRRLARRAVTTIDLRHHAGAHPRLGSLDVVPFVALSRSPGRRLAPGQLGTALAARDRFCRWAADELDLPCFAYGPERTLPDVRRRAWRQLAPTAGSRRPHPRAGACAVGARPPLIAYNLWLAEPDLNLARRVVAALRDPTSGLWASQGAPGQPGAGSGVRALALPLASGVQVSCNLVDPWRVGPAEVYDAVTTQAPVARAELVGLVPGAVLDRVPSRRWAQLGLAGDTTVEARLARTEARRRAAGLGGEVPGAPTGVS